MSILIKGMEMPKNCGDCRLCINPNFNQRPLCSAERKYFDDMRHKQNFCPLIPVPDHGRLIDTEQSASNAVTPIENRQYKPTNDELSRMLMYAIAMIKDGAE